MAEVGLYRELGVPALAMPKSQEEVVKTAQTLALASIFDIGVFLESCSSDLPMCGAGAISTGCGH